MRYIIIINRTFIIFNDLANKGLQLQRKLANFESFDQREQLKLMENLGDFYSKIELIDKAIYYYKQQVK